MLLGWLAILQCGYLQRDVSIGNILKLRTPVKMNPFSIQKLLDYRDALFGAKTTTGQPEIQHKVDHLKDLVKKERKKAAMVFNGIVRDATELKELVDKKLKFTGICKAIISDGDLAAYIPTYFATPHDKGQLSVCKYTNSPHE